MARNKRAARPTPSVPKPKQKDDSVVGGDGSNGQDVELDGPSSDSAPTSAAVTAREEQEQEQGQGQVPASASPPSPPPPPPPPPPLSPTLQAGIKGGVRLVRRQSTSSKEPVYRNRNGDGSGHTRSATDPSSSTPNPPSLARGAERPSSPAAELESALKRHNTMGSLTPSSLRKLRAKAGSGDVGVNANANATANANANADTNASTNTNTNANIDASANSNIKPNGNTNAPTPTSTNERRTSSPPPPVKPKPANLSLQKKKTHERSGSTGSSALLKTALVHGASAAAAVALNGNGNGTNGKPSPGSASASSGSGSGSGSSTPTKSERTLTPVEEPERRNSVQSIARSLEGTLHFSTPPSPGTPPTLRNRTSVASSRSVRDGRDGRSVKDGLEGDVAEKDEPRDGETREERAEKDSNEREGLEVDGRDRDRDQISSTPPPADFRAVIASLVDKGIRASEFKSNANANANASKASGASSPSPSPPTPASAPVPPARSRSPPPPTTTKPKVKPKPKAKEEAEAVAESAPPAPASSQSVDTSTPVSPPASPPAQAATNAEAEAEKKEEEKDISPVSPPADPVPSSPNSTEDPSPSLPLFPPVPPVSTTTTTTTESAPETSPPAPAPISVTRTPSKRYSIPPPLRQPPPPPIESSNADADADAEERKDPGLDRVPTIPTPSTEEPASDVKPESQNSTTTPAPVRRYSIPPPPRPPPPIPEEEGALPTPIDEVDEDEQEEEGLEGQVTHQDEGEEEKGGEGVFGGIVVQEPEEMGEIADEQDVQTIHVEGEYDSAEDSSSDDDLHESFKSALSRNASSSLPPTPPTKYGISFPIHLTSKWSRNTSAAQSANASASTLALHEQEPVQTQVHIQAEPEAEVESDAEENASQGDTTLAHANVNDLHDAKDLDDIDAKQVNTKEVEEDPMDSRFKFPPVSSFPPPPPLPFKRNNTNINRNLRMFGGPNGSESSLASVVEDESADEADRDTVLEPKDPRFGKKSKAKSKLKLTSAIAAALAIATPAPPLPHPPPAADDNQTISHAETDSTTASRSSSEETNPIARQMRARLAKLDGHGSELPRPAPFPTTGDGAHGQSQSVPEVPLARLRVTGAGAGGDDRRTVRLSSKLHPITDPQRMNTSPSSVTAWGKHKAVMSSDTVGTIGTIATEPGDLETSQFGSISGAAAPPLPPPSSFLNRVKSDVGWRPPMRRQTTSTSQASRFVEDMHVSLPFFKRSASPPPMSITTTSPPHQRSMTISFTSRARTGSQATMMGPPTRKNSLVPELRAATIEAAERPLSAVSGDFVLVEEPEEFDIPRAEWDLPRIPSGSLRMPSSMDLKIKARAHESEQQIGGERNGLPKRGPSSAPATTAPSMPVAPLMQHSRSATTGTSGSSGTTSTAKTSASAPAAPAPISFQQSTGSDGTANTAAGRLSSDTLLDLWGRVGVYMSDAAALLHDKSRRVLVGDGTYPGFVLAVSRQVPTACIPSRSARYPYGHLIYFQTAATVHKRYAEVLPGDVIVLQNALFKGVRGPLHQSYQEELGTKGDPIVGVIGEFEARKSKVRVYQANQHVGMQTVEYVTYRFDDLKSGTIKIFRVPDS